MPFQIHGIKLLTNSLGPTLVVALNNTVNNNNTVSQNKIVAPSIQLPKTIRFPIIIQEGEIYHVLYLGGEKNLIGV
jgi:hypothetical protein